MESPFASWMEHYAASYSATTPDTDKQDLMITLLQEKGNVHEKAILADLKSKGLKIVNLSESVDPIEDTLSAEVLTLFFKPH